MQTESDLDHMVRLSLELADCFWEVETALWFSLQDDPVAALHSFQDDLAEREGAEYRPGHTVDRIRSIRIEVFSAEHAPPHFHVSGPDIDATFRVSDGSLLAGTISKKNRRVVESFFNKHRRKVVAVWNRTRPDGSPVGFVFEDPEAPGGILYAKPSQDTVM